METAQNHCAEGSYFGQKIKQKSGQILVVFENFQVNILNLNKDLLQTNCTATQRAFPVLKRHLMKVDFSGVALASNLPVVLNPFLLRE